MGGGANDRMGHTYCVPFSSSIFLYTNTQTGVDADPGEDRSARSEVDFVRRSLRAAARVRYTHLHASHARRAAPPCGTEPVPPVYRTVRHSCLSKSPVHVRAALGRVPADLWAKSQPLDTRHG